MYPSMLQGLVAAALAAGVSAAAFAQVTNQPACGNAMLRGNYGIQMQGTNASSPGGPIQTVIGVVVRRYDGNGNITQFDNIKGSITGMVPDRFGMGTYRVNDDCSVIIEFNPAPGVVIQEKGVLVDNGHEVRTITVTPATTMVTAVHLRM
ncbi:MAG: hypothetical protein U1F15_06895 [Burkholderiales bacterium]